MDSGKRVAVSVRWCRFYPKHKSNPYRHTARRITGPVWPVYDTQMYSDHAGWPCVLLQNRIWLAWYIIRTTGC